MKNDILAWPFFTVALITDLIGICCNIVVLCFLFNRRVGSHRTTLLMKSQSIFDGLASLNAILSLSVYDSKFASPRGPVLIICHLWVSRWLFWFLTLLSKCNLTCLVIDRLQAILFPRRYNAEKRRILFLSYIFIIIYSFITCLPWPFTVSYHDHRCYHNPEEGYLKSYIITSYVWLINAYLIPGVMLNVGNAVIVYRLVSSRRQSQFNQIQLQLRASGRLSLDKNESRGSASSSVSNKVINVAQQCSKIGQSLVVPTAIMGVSYTITQIYHVIFCFLVSYGVVKFDARSIERRIGIFLTIINSTCNPIILFLSSPPLRRNLWQFIRQARRRVNLGSSSTSHSHNSHSSGNGGRMTKSAQKQSISGGHYTV